MSPLAEVREGAARLAREESGPVPRGGFQRLNPLEQPEWDKLLRSHKAATFFHGASWAAVLRDTYGHTPHYFCALTGDRLSAVMPVMEVNSRLTGRRGVSLPFTDECAYLSDGSGAGEEVFPEMIQFGKRRKWRSIEWRGDKACPGGSRPSQTFFSHNLAVSDRQDRIFGRFESGVRRAIRKAERAKIQVEISPSLEALESYYSLHCKTRKKHGLPPQSWSFFRSIFQNVLLKGMGFVVVARHRNRPIAAAVFFQFAGQAIFKFGASDSAYQHLRGNNLVMWEAIQWHAGRGYDSLNFGRTSIGNEGLRRFKLGFGAQERKLEYFKYDFARDGFVAGRDGVVGWYNGAFRLMPIPLSRLIGRLLYKHLS